MMGKIPAVHEVQLAQDYLQQDGQMNGSGHFSPGVDCRDCAGKNKLTAWFISKISPAFSLNPFNNPIAKQETLDFGAANSTFYPINATLLKSTHSITGFLKCHINWLKLIMSMPRSRKGRDNTTCCIFPCDSRIYFQTCFSFPLLLSPFSILCNSEQMKYLKPDFEPLPAVEYTSLRNHPAVIWWKHFSKFTMEATWNNSELSPSFCSLPSNLHRFKTPFIPQSVCTDTLSYSVLTH